MQRITLGQAFDLPFNLHNVLLADSASALLVGNPQT